MRKIATSKMAFKCMENINCFLEACRKFGVPNQELFQTVDLWEKQNLNSVVICLQALGRKVIFSRSQDPHRTARRHPPRRSSNLFDLRSNKLPSPLRITAVGPGSNPLSRIDVRSLEHCRRGSRILCLRVQRVVLDPDADEY